MSCLVGFYYKCQKETGEKRKKWHGQTWLWNLKLQGKPDGGKVLMPLDKEGNLDDSSGIMENRQSQATFIN